jgi:hypothetical protein
MGLKWNELTSSLKTLFVVEKGISHTVTQPKEFEDFFLLLQGLSLMEHKWEENPDRTLRIFVQLSTFLSEKAILTTVLNDVKNHRIKLVYETLERCNTAFATQNSVMKILSGSVLYF